SIGWCQTAPALEEYTPAPCNDILFNPRMGLYLQYPALDSKPDEWFMKVCDIAYYRLDWSAVNPQPGVYTFDEYFKPMLDFWVTQQGKRFAFRVMSQSMHSRGQVTPQWVFDQGVPGVQHVALNGKPQTDPVFWDDRYLDAQCQFIRKLGEYFADKPGPEFVDIGGIGEWGEMHLARWTSQQLEQTGFTQAKYARAYRRMIDAYVQAFPHTQIFLNVGGQDHQSINDYAAIRGVNFRQDGLMPAGASYDCGEWLYKPYSRRGVSCMFEFHSGYDDMVKKNWDVKTTIEKGLSAPISYLNTNLFGGAGYRKATPEVQEMLADAARRVGYRFVLTSVKRPRQLNVVPGRASRLPLEVTWRNDGIAPCYDSLATRWSLVDAEGKAVAQEECFPRVPTTQWWPGEPQTAALVLRVPEGLKPGEYTLRVTMFVPETGKTILLGIQGKQPDGSYALCPVPAVAGEATANTGFETGFETEDKPWTAVPGITTTLVTEGAHEGQKALLVSGTADTVWNYASCRLPQPLVAFGKYRLSAWMKMDECSSKQMAPYLKIGVNGTDGKWITNFSTERYDLGKLGAWQLLQGTAELPANAATADLAIEKGDNTTPVTLKLWLDDVKLELLEAP
ncbi:MAG: DUF4832 domain-containing protein, partial [Bacteroidota bacterium]